jgi:hypothetical protein
MAALGRASSTPKICPSSSIRPRPRSSTRAACSMGWTGPARPSALASRRSSSKATWMSSPCTRRVLPTRSRPWAPRSPSTSCTCSSAYTRRIVLALDPMPPARQSHPARIAGGPPGMDTSPSGLRCPRLDGYEARLQADIRVTTLPPGMDPDEVVNRDPRNGNAWWSKPSRWSCTSWNTGSRQRPERSQGQNSRSLPRSCPLS